MKKLEALYKKSEWNEYIAIFFIEDEIWKVFNNNDTIEIYITGDIKSVGEIDREDIPVLQEICDEISSCYHRYQEEIQNYRNKNID